MQQQLKQILLKARSLEPFPDVAVRVLELSGQESVVPGELIAIIQTDPGLTGKILRLCNSAYYGFSQEIASINEAGNVLGVRSLVNLVLTTSAGKYFRDLGKSSETNQGELWRRSVTHAIASRLIAARSHRVDIERAYTAGLLQNVGSLVLDRFFQEGQAYVHAVAAQGYTLIEAEKHALGIHHAELGARLMTRWNLPEVLTDTVRYHHAPEQAKVDPVLTATVHLAETVTAARLAGDSLPGLAYEVHAAALELTGLDPSDFELIEAELLTEMEKAGELLEL